MITLVFRRLFQHGARRVHHKEVVRQIFGGRIVGHEADRCHIHRDLTFADAKKAADIDQYGLDPAIARHDHVVDFADILPVGLNTVKGIAFDLGLRAVDPRLPMNAEAWISIGSASVRNFAS